MISTPVPEILSWDWGEIIKWSDEAVEIQSAEIEVQAKIFGAKVKPRRKR